MDPSSAEDVTRAFILEYSTLAGHSIYIYHYLLTLDDEVAHIWSQRWNLGKTVFLLVRYIPFIRIATDLCVNIRIWTLFETKSCAALVWIFSPVAYHFQISAADGAFLLCTYALLGAEKIHSAILLALYAAFTVPLLVVLVLTTVAAKFVPPELLSSDEQHDGRACHIDYGDKLLLYRKINDYLVIVGTVVAALLGVATIVMRYRNQQSSLINVIRRDGGIFYLSAIALRVSTFILALPNIQMHIYNLIYTAQYVALPMLAAALILDLASGGVKAP
ncbi:hypothetical protein DFP72DRAFT_1058162 [Ephemerocybe angulata]|uniref:DUF6533 domain-containing protein n=1 Tax=Ephemerocybe angulata TaxID=980116 RepID=A0A8H6MEF9_9AGAR|nr:hypothetical protein DFP72DRAFT_1058162 [Tulosesus angulatus]